LSIIIDDSHQAVGGLASLTIARANIVRTAVQSSGAAALPNKRSKSGLGTSRPAI